MAEPTGCDIVFCSRKISSLSLRDIALHLRVPLVISPAVELRRHLRPFFKRKLFDRRLDLLDAHSVRS
jgi:hypothetical protein